MINLVRDLKDTNIRITALEGKPYFFTEKGTNNYNGYLYNILLELQSQFGFVFNIDVVNDTRNFNKDGHYDIYLNLFTHPISNSSYVERSYPVFHDRLRLYCCRPEFKHHWNAYIMPFNGSLWLAIGLTLVALSIILNESSRLFRYFSKKEEVINFLTSFFSILGVFLQQGSECKSTSQGIKMIMWITFVTSLAIFTAYKAHLTSNLTYTKLESSVKTFDDVINMKLQLITIKNSIAQLWLKKTSEPHFKRLYDYLITDEKNLLLNESLTSHLLSQRLVFILATDRSILYLEPPQCELDHIDVTSEIIVSSIGYNKNFKFKNQFNKHLSKLNEIGILKKYSSNYLKYDHQNDCEECKSFFAFGFSHVSFILYCWFIGLFLALLILIIEYFHHNTIIKKQRKKWKNCVHKNLKINSVTNTTSCQENNSEFFVFCQNIQ